MFGFSHIMYFFLYFLYSWFQIPNMNLPRLGATSILDNNDDMWVFGGTHNTGISSVKQLFCKMI